LQPQNHGLKSSCFSEHSKTAIFLPQKYSNFFSMTLSARQLPVLPRSIPCCFTKGNGQQHEGEGWGAFPLHAAANLVSYCCEKSCTTFIFPLLSCYWFSGLVFLKQRCLSVCTQLGDFLHCNR
jgi:hypothetical protein